MTLRATPHVPQGRVIVRRHDGNRDGQPWFLIEIGRGKYVKRINISSDEAGQLISELARLSQP
jgi:hypothetical protein